MPNSDEPANAIAPEMGQKTKLFLGALKRAYEYGYSYGARETVEKSLVFDNAAECADALLEELLAALAKKEEGGR